jgi:hypothetical protein
MDLVATAVALAGRTWRAQVHLWQSFLDQDPWQAPRAGDAAALHWVGQALEGAVLPGVDGSSGRPPPAG